jgi:hypothetical protein
LYSWLLEESLSLGKCYSVPGVDYPNVNLNTIPGYDNPLEMLQYQGGPGIPGAERMLLRAYIAAFLNKAEFGSGYSLNIPAVKAAWASGNRQRMLDLAKIPDDNNNTGCPLFQPFSSWGTQTYPHPY